LARSKKVGGIYWENEGFESVGRYVGRFNNSETFGWQRCQFHLQRDAQAYVPKKTMQKQVSGDIADIFAAPCGELAQVRLKYYVEKYAVSAPELSEWMEENLPEGLTVFEFTQKHRRRMRTTNPLERLHEEINRRTRVARLFPNGASLLRLVSAIEMEISEDWVAGKRYLNMKTEMENENESANSGKKKITENMLLNPIIFIHIKNGSMVYKIKVR